MIKTTPRSGFLMSKEKHLRVLFNKYRLSQGASDFLNNHQKQTRLFARDYYQI